MIILILLQPLLWFYVNAVQVTKCVKIRINKKGVLSITYLMYLSGRYFIKHAEHDGQDMVTY
jgi:hypothetical protein